MRARRLEPALFAALLTALSTACPDDDATSSDAGTDATAELDAPSELDAAPETGDAPGELDTTPADTPADIAPETLLEVDAIPTDGDVDPLACLIGGEAVAEGASAPGDPCRICDPARDASDYSPAATGTRCEGGVCRNGACEPACRAYDSAWAIGDRDPLDLCRVCDPFVDPDGFVPGPEGASCELGGVCVGGACRIGCLIDGTLAAPGEPHPTVACLACDPVVDAFAWRARPDGAACASGSHCDRGECVRGCFIDGEVHADGAPDPRNPCQLCRAETSTTAWSAHDDGRICGDARVCVAGACGEGCFIDGALVPLDAELGPCRRCDADEPLAPSDRPDGTPCEGGVCRFGVCSAACFVDGVLHDALAPDPAAHCRVCDPALSAVTFSPAPDGTPCTAGRTCVGGACLERCVIDGVVHEAGASDPENPCAVCDPSVGTAQWSSVDNGQGCGAGLVCAAGVCQGGCVIADALRLPEVVAPGNPCQSCQPALDTSAWSPRPDGTACGQGAFCANGYCEGSCLIDGELVAAGTIDGGCRVCSPSEAATAWTPLDDGRACGGGGLCHDGVCTSGCMIQGRFYAAGELDAQSPCRRCDPTRSVSAWTPLTDGATCGDDGVCWSGFCESGCWLGDEHYRPGASIDGPCRVCRPALSQTSQSFAEDGTTCGAAAYCLDGTCHTGCFIDGQVIGANSPSPDNPCLACRLDRSSTAYTRRDDGASCPTGTCVAGACVAAPTVTEVSPACGPDTGGTLVHIAGRGFAPGATVRFGTAAGTHVQVASSTALYTQTPTSGISGPGAVAVSVQNHFGPATSLAAAFTFHGFYHLGPATSVSPTTHSPRAVDFGDLDRDGRRDVVLLSDERVIVLYNRVNGLGPPWLASTSGSAAATSVHVADLDDDAHLDVVRVSQLFIEVLPGTAAGELGLATQIRGWSVGPLSAGTMADVTGDGVVDLIVRQGDTLGTFVGLGDGTFELVPYFLFGASDQLASGDVDGDGLADLLVSTDLYQGAWFLYTQGDGTYRIGRLLELASPIVRLFVAHLDDDGIADAILATRDGVYVALSAPGELEHADPEPVGTLPSPLVVAVDVNQDGRVDLVHYVGDQLHVYLGSGRRDRPFGCRRVIQTFSGGTLVGASDLDGDGMPDVLLGYPSSTVLRHLSR